MTLASVSSVSPNGVPVILCSLCLFSLFLSLSFFSFSLFSLLSSVFFGFWFFFLSFFFSFFLSRSPPFSFFCFSVCLYVSLSLSLLFSSILFFTVGDFHPDLRVISFEEMATRFNWVREGGIYSSNRSDVSSDTTRVAILIPFRKREEHLQILLNNLHPFLYNQQLDYTVYVVEQVFAKRVGNSSFD